MSQAIDIDIDKVIGLGKDLVLVLLEQIDFPAAIEKALARDEALRVVSLIKKELPPGIANSVIKSTIDDLAGRVRLSFDGIRDRIAKREEF